MNKGLVSGAIVVLAGAVIGFILGSLITWFPIRLAYCAAYNAPDCEEIVLILFPFYCLIAPFLGSITAYWLYQKQR
jgi:hypothetical protein